jgi:hypothetical protein
MIVMLVTVGQLLQISELGLLPSLFPNGTLATDMDHLRFGMPRKTNMVNKIYLSRLFRMLSTGLNGLYMFCLYIQTEGVLSLILKRC